MQNLRHPPETGGNKQNSKKGRCEAEHSLSPSVRSPSHSSLLIHQTHVPLSLDRHNTKIHRVLHNPGQLRHHALVSTGEPSALLHQEGTFPSSSPPRGAAVRELKSTHCIVTSGAQLTWIIPIPRQATNTYRAGHLYGGEDHLGGKERVLSILASNAPDRRSQKPLCCCQIKRREPEEIASLDLLRR